MENAILIIPEICLITYPSLLKQIQRTQPKLKEGKGKMSVVRTSKAPLLSLNASLLLLCSPHHLYKGKL